MRWWERSLVCSRKLGARNDEAMTLQELGRRTGSRGSLELAEAIFAEIRRGLEVAAPEPRAEAPALAAV